MTGMRIALAGTLASVIAMVMAAPAGAQQATAIPPTQDAPEADVAAQADVVVTGIRASIASAVQTKRDAVNIVDSISAQDIGKLPDQNVVDTLSRIPGVQITRSRGDGANFTIRGISLNTVLINGRPFVGPTSGSSDRLDVLSSDIVGSIDVIKSPSADMIEGALGGTVNLITKHPLDLRNGTIAVRAQGQYGDLIGKTGFRGSALVSTKSEDGRFGALMSVAYQRIQTEQQLFITEGYNRVNDIDGNGDGVNDAGLFRPSRMQLSVLPRPVERLTLNSAIQIKPTDELELLADMTYNKFDARGYPERYQVLLNSNDVNAVADADKTVVAGTFTGVTLRPLVYQEDDHSKLYTLGGKASWKHDGWNATLDASYAKGVAPFDAGTFTFVVQPRPGLITNVAYDLRGNGVPSFSLTGNYDLSNPVNFRVASISDNSNTNRNAATAVRADVARDLGLNLLKRLDLGYRYEDRLFYTARRVYPSVLAAIVARADTDRNGVVTPGELPSVSYRPENDVLPGLSGTFPRSFPGGRVDADAARAMFGYTLPPIAPTTVSNVRQQSHSVYAKLDLQGDVLGMPVRGNIGGRYVRVSRVSRGNVDVGGTIRPVAYDKSYGKFLPSATINLEPSDDVIVRLAAARVVATPPLADLAAGFTYNITSNTGTGGNPELDPYEADQADATIEWYRGRGNLLSLALFYKKVRSFTTLYITEETLPGFQNPNGTGNVFRITRPRNGSDGEVKGVEVNAQQSLDFLPSPLDGLGVQANYTYADSKTPIVDELTGRTLPLPVLSKNSYSLIGYYEKGPIQARVAYTGRDGYLFAVQPAAQAGSRYVGKSNQLDASLSIEVLSGVKLAVDAQNLLRGALRQYDGVATRVSQITLDDRRFFFGVSAAF